MGNRPAIGAGSTGIGVFRLIAVLVVVSTATGGCNGNSAPTGPRRGTVAPDFAIRDANPNSARYDRLVSPRDYLGRVSAWYFGHAT